MKPFIFIFLKVLALQFLLGSYFIQFKNLIISDKTYDFNKFNYNESHHMVKISRAIDINLTRVGERCTTRTFQSFF